MKQIVEYLLSKSKPKTTGNSELIISIFNEFYPDRMPDDKADRIRKHCNDKDFAFIRIYGSEVVRGRRGADGKLIKQSPNDYLLSDYAKDFKGLVFSNLIHEELAGNIIDDACENVETECTTESWDGENDSYGLIMGKDFIYYDSSEIDGFLFERIDNDTEVNPKIDRYWIRHNSYIELSSRKILLDLDELKDESNQEYLDDFINTISTSYVKDFEDETDVELTIGGRGGRHVCVEETFNSIHKYDYLKKTVEEFQDSLVAEINNEISILNGQDE